MSARGTDRFESSRGMRIDADWDGKDGESIRMIQQRGLGGAALYAIRVKGLTDKRPDIYRYDVEQDEVCQLDKDLNRTAITLSPDFLHDRLRRAFITD